MAIIRWTPVRDLEDMFSAMFDRSLSSLSSDDGLLGQQMVPAMDVVTQGDDLEIRLEVPGLDPDQDIDVSIEDGMLFIAGERHISRERNEESYVVREMASGSFVRSFPLPEGVEESDIKAEYSDGLLTIHITGGAVKSEQQRKHIPIGNEAQSGLSEGQGQAEAKAQGEVQPQVNAQRGQAEPEQAAEQSGPTDDEREE